MITRRHLVATGALAALSVGFAPRIAFAAAPTDRRFVFIIQRGAADGLGTLAPVGDPAFAGARGVLAEDFATGTKLDGMFTLHPALAQVAQMHAAKQALFAHAVASPYRDRSHFDGQNVLETGGAGPYQVQGRLAQPAAHAAAGGRAARDCGGGDRADGPARRGGGRVLRPVRPAAGVGRSARAGDQPLCQRPATARAVGSGDGDARADRAIWPATTGVTAPRPVRSRPGCWCPPTARASRRSKPAGGTRTPGNARALRAQLRGLDAMIAALKTGLGPLWDKTLVLVATEFGRTVAVNGTGGTDHGPASAAMLLGGGVAGGRVIADWPGLAPANLYEGRDLKPTLDLDALIAGAVSAHFGLDPARTKGALFPGAAAARPVEGLVRA